MKLREFRQLVGSAAPAQEVPATQPPKFEPVYYYQPVLQLFGFVQICAIIVGSAGADVMTGDHGLRGV